MAFGAPRDLKLHPLLGPQSCWSHKGLAGPQVKALGVASVFGLPKNQLQTFSSFWLLAASPRSARRGGGALPVDRGVSRVHAQLLTLQALRA